jgi:hypothetical protein
VVCAAAATGATIAGIGGAESVMPTLLYVG